MKGNLFKKFLAVLVLFLTGSSFAQGEMPTLIFKNGDTLHGISYAFKGKKIKFRKNKESEFIKYDLDDVSKVKLVSKYGGIAVFVRLPIMGKRQKQTMQLTVEGPVSLYEMVGSVSTDGSYITSYYVKRSDEEAVAFMGSTNPLITGFRKRAIKYFKDCEPLVEKLKKKEFMLRNMKEITYYYSENCAKN